jgi:hypothetical protein
MDTYPTMRQQPPRQAPQQLEAELQEQEQHHVKPQLELQLGPQEFGVTTVAAPVGAAAPAEPCCTPPPPATAVAPPPPSHKVYEGIRDVHVSVALMEEFMRCAVVLFSV